MSCAADNSILPRRRQARPRHTQRRL